MFSQNIVWNIPSAILNVKWNKSRQEIGSKASVRLSTALTECWSSNLMTRTKPRFLKDIQSDIEFKLPVLKTESVPVFIGLIGALGLLEALSVYHSKEISDGISKMAFGMFMMIVGIIMICPIITALGIVYSISDVKQIKSKDFARLL